MKVTLKWLNEFVDISDKSAKEIAYLLSIRGIETEAYSCGRVINSVVIGKIQQIERHPNADKLSVCKVCVLGNETLQIVCGADNIYEGMYVPVAMISADFGDGFVIKRAKLRGVESEGMLCSKQELGFENKSSGIWDLTSTVSGDSDLGKSFYDFIQVVEGIETDITPNRADALGVYGVAREIATILNRKLKMPELKNQFKFSQGGGSFDVKIKNTDVCKRYGYAIIKNVKVKPSSSNISKKLESLGLKPINNLVDITNYMLFEFNHPMHVFDLKKLKGSIVVDNAKNSEKIRALNGNEYELDSSVVTIRDNSGAVAIAGIIGGEPTAVSDETTDILLECAWFDPVTTRKSRAKLDISTDSSYRFERGIDIDDIEYAVSRAVDLLLEEAGGDFEGMYDVYPTKKGSIEIKTDFNEMKEFLDINISYENAVLILNNLGITSKYDNGLIVSVVPGFRPDIFTKEDIYEEIARIYGYENIPVKIPLSVSGKICEDDKFDKELFNLKLILKGMGFREVYACPMTGDKSDIDLISSKPHFERVKLQNSLNCDINSMRTSTISSLVKIAEHNINRFNSDIRVFETGFIYFKNSLVNEHCSIEIPVLSVLMVGNRENENWANVKPAQVDYFDIKGVMSALVSSFGSGKVEFITKTIPFYEYGQTVLLNGDEIGFIGLIKKNLAGVESELFHFEVEYKKLFTMKSAQKKYVPITKFPIVMRDLSFIVDKSIASQTVKATIKKYAGDYLTKVEEFDYFESEKLGIGKRSISYRMAFTPVESTFTDTEIEKYFSGVIDGVKKELGIELRV